ncbi:MAG TPA: histidine phosphatase family protein [Pseudolabrys sp.]|jgi:phosphohistidine phosphatase SixA|nr:histidine phosphatase family protein [Pseudolabrys sp.]
MLTKSTSRTATLLLCLLVLLTLSPQRASADNEQLWAGLKHGGKIILLRHTHVDIREGIGRLSPGNCVEEVNLSSRGVEQAKRLGEAFRAHGIAIGRVLTSPYCRCIDTGTLAFGRATPVQYLRPPGTVSEDQAKLNHERVVQEILKHRDPSNMVMITHDLNIADVVLEDTVPMGEFFVVQPKGTDFEVLGKIHLDDR